jgi:hypothetical protein
MSNNYGYRNAHSVLCPKMHACELKPKLAISDAPRVATMRNCLLASLMTYMTGGGGYVPHSERSFPALEVDTTKTICVQLTRKALMPCRARTCPKSHNTLANGD